MNTKRTAIIFVGGVALAAWLSAAMTPGRPPAVPTAIKPAPIDASGAALSGEIARLRERLRPDAAPRQTSRNPFVFRSKPRAVANSPAGNARAVAAADASIATPAEAPLRLALSGVAEDPGADGAPVRTAILAGNGQLVLAKEGDTVADRGVQYKIGTITADSAELIDLRDNTIHRLGLK